MQVPILYNREMAADVDSFSRSPSKPKMLVDRLSKDPRFYIRDFFPFNKEDFLVAHTEEYVDGFFNGAQSYMDSIRIKWSAEYVNSVRYTNASLYNAIFSALNSGFSICPASGFHHATPGYGLDFCAFSGQVIASTKIYRELGFSGAYFDLDAHFGNSIQDSYRFVPDLKMSVPRGCNVNPVGILKKHYFADLKNKIKKVVSLIEQKKIHYVVIGHGADSIIGDNAEAGFLELDDWIEAANMIKRSCKCPIVYCLFGGYRDNISEVVDFHVRAINALLEPHSAR